MVLLGGERLVVSDGRGDELPATLGLVDAPIGLTR
jgi:hypothetical protein